MKVAIVGGAGYVGVVTGVGLAAIGHDVVSVDADRDRIQTLSAGSSPVYEDGLADLLGEVSQAGRIRFTTSLRDGAEHGDVVVIAVGTPSRDDGRADLSQVIRVAEEIAEHLTAGYKVVVVKSTVPVGTAELMRSILRRRSREGEQFDIVANPEFLREGKGLHDFFNPDRIVIGTSSERARDIMRRLYEPIVAGSYSWPARERDRHMPVSVPVVETDLASAQMIKYAANAFLAMRISFINEVAGLSERVGADVREVVRGLGYDPRIGPAYLHPGLGFGGPCLEKDLRALIKLGEETRYDSRLLRAVLERNQKQVREIIGKVKEAAGYLLYKRIIAVFGLAFKAGTNDVRNSLALRIVGELEEAGAVVHAHDPFANAEAKSLRPSLVCFEDPYDAVVGADVLIIATEWSAFRELDYRLIKARMAQPCIVDARNLLVSQNLRGVGYLYFGVGIP